MNETPVKLFAAIFFKEEEHFDKACEILERAYSGIDYCSRRYPFNHSDYYEKEMGTNLKKRILSFEKILSPEFLTQSKLVAQEIEESCSLDGKRRVNIDMGYLDLFKVVLASTKGRGNKIYLSQGIWADMTLYFEKGKFQHFPWSFPDFKSGTYDKDLLLIRDLYKEQLKTL